MAVRRIMKPTTPHFFRALPPGFQQQISVPVAFYLQHLKEKNPEKVVLRSPSGKLCHVKMNGRLFEDGWEEFCEAHDLQVGDFLVFRHVGDLVFDVLVFDSSTCHRNYPAFSVKEEILETPPPVPQEEETPSPGKLAKKKKKKGITNFEGKAGPSVIRTNYPSFSVKEEITETPPQEEESPKEYAGKLAKQKGQFEGKAGSLDSQYPHFMLTLSCYSAISSVVYIPRPFARENGLDSRKCKAVLLNEQGKVWMASIGIKRDRQPYISSWPAFRLANSLKTGDSCIFELIRDGEKPVLKITKLNLNPKPEKGPTIKVAQTGSSSRNPRVHLTVTESFMKNNVLRIPTWFAEKSGLTRESRERMTLQNEKGRSWTASLQKRSTGGVRIGFGWSTFATANGIKEGDVLKLELIKRGKKPVIRISGAKRGAESEKKRSGTLYGVKRDSQIKQEANIM